MWRRNSVGVVSAAAAGILLQSAGCSASPAPGESLSSDARAPTPPDSSHPSGDLTSPAADAGRAPSPLACPPSPRPYAPPASYVPAVAHQGLCTTADITDFVSACVDPGLECTAWTEENVADVLDGGSGTPCGNCLSAPPTENNGGLWLDPNSLFFPNYAGCVQILDPRLGTACPEAYDEAVGCQALACEYCPEVGANGIPACVDAAEATRCASYVAKVDTACSGAANVFNACSPDDHGPGDFVFVTTLICGAPPLDGGPDTGADAAGD